MEAIMPILLKNQFVNSREEILEVETPQPLTETHVPIKHSFFIEQADKNFEENNLTIKEENFWLRILEYKFWILSAESVSPAIMILNPLYSGGLCEPVTMTPELAPFV